MPMTGFSIRDCRRDAPLGSLIVGHTGRVQAEPHSSHRAHVSMRPYKAVPLPYPVRLSSPSVPKTRRRPLDRQEQARFGGFGLHVSKAPHNPLANPLADRSPHRIAQSRS